MPWSALGTTATDRDGHLSEVRRKKVKNPSLSEKCVVYIVCDDAADRQSVRQVAGSVRLTCEAYATGDAFFEGYAADFPSCLVLEFRLHEKSGLQLQTRLVQAQIDIPIIFLSANASVPMTVRAMRQGAFDVLVKPCAIVIVHHVLVKPCTIPITSVRPTERSLDGRLLSFTMSL